MWKTRTAGPIVALSALGLLALAAGFALAAPAAPPAAPSALTGVTSLRFSPEILADLGIEQVDVVTTAAPLRDGALGFALGGAGSSATLRAQPPDFEGFDAADLHHAGGFSWLAGASRIDLAGFRLTEGAAPHSLELRDAQGGRWLFVDQPHALIAAGQLSIANADLVIAPELAARLGRPDLEGSFVGVLDAEIALAPPAPAALGAATAAALGGCVGDFTQPVDLVMLNLSGMTQAVREPGGRVAIAPNATVRNQGPGDVQWYVSILPDTPVGPHPFLALNFYRLSNGVLEQIGRADLKHTFFATNSNCPCPGDQILYANCEDLYGVFTNLDRWNLAPREELDAFAVSWTSLGSHFDGTPVDDVRDHDGDADHDNFQHRLVVQEPDLNTPGARYFYDGWYIAPNDSNLLNSMGHRETDPTFGGSTWTFPTVGSGAAQGSILDVWVNPASVPPGQATELYDTSEGRLQLAVISSDLGGGVFHYEYALMNFDYERQVRTFSLPLDAGQLVTNAGFGDADGNAANDWTASVEPTRVIWTAPAGNELDWGTLYNFRVDVNAPPVEVRATLTPLEPGAPAPLSVRTLPEPEGAASLAPAAALLVLLARRRARH